MSSPGRQSLAGYHRERSVWVPLCPQHAKPVDQLRIFILKRPDLTLQIFHLTLQARDLIHQPLRALSDGRGGLPRREKRRD
jgi:hypothetical protein